MAFADVRRHGHRSHWRNAGFGCRPRAFPTLQHYDNGSRVCSVGRVLQFGRARDISAAERPKTVVTLAGWLAPQLMRLFGAPTTSPVRSFSGEQNARFASLVAETIPASRDSVRGLSTEEALVHPRYLAMLTALWAAWLQHSVTDQIALPPIPDALAAQWPLETFAIGESLSADSRAAGDEAWRRWLSETPALASIFPAIVERVIRLATLETDFASALLTAKLEALKEFAYGAGHELNNPLANIATRAEMLLKQETDPERRRRLTAINRQAFRAHEMLADMMLFARPPKLQPRPLDVVTLANDVLSELADDASRQETKLIGPESNEPITISGDPIQLRVALKALVANSLEALARAGNIKIEVTKSPTAVEITVSDDGPGIPAGMEGRIFDPFFSGREAGRGLGLGLSKCWRIVKLNGGTINVGAKRSRGCCFKICLPTASPSK